MSLSYVHCPALSISKTEDFYVDVIERLGRHSSRGIDIICLETNYVHTKAGNFNLLFKTYKFEDR